MRKFRSLCTIASAMLLTMTAPVVSAADDGGSAGSNPGDAFSDLVIALRDVNGVPLLRSFTVDGEAGPTTEYCVQPVSVELLPGMAAADQVVNEADGRAVYPIPLMGELPIDPAAVDEVEVCDPQPAYASYVEEAELERLNLARQPDEVRDRKLSDVELKLASADVIALDGAGRITVDGAALDAAPEYAAIFASLMSTGTIPGIDSSPAQVEGFDAWMLAATAVGTASSKGVPLTIDAVEYYFRIVKVPANYLPSADWTLEFLGTDPPGSEQFVDFGDFSYTRSDVFQGCSTWLDVPSLTWMVSPIADVVEFGELPPVAVGGTVDNVAGFTQLADDVRATILYLHENEVIPGFYLDPVGTNTCDAQTQALTNPAVAWGGVPTDLIQTETMPITTSVYMPWAGTTVAGAQFEMTIEATEAGQSFAAGTQVTAQATDGPNAGDFVTFDVVGGTLVGRTPGTFALTPGDQATTTFEFIVAAGAPTGAYDLTLDLVDLGASDAVLATDMASTMVADAALTVLWTTDVDFATQGTYVPFTARVFNPDLGQAPLPGAALQVTIDAPEPFVLPTQVGAWSEAVPMSFTLDSSGDLIGSWPLVDPLPVPYDELITWSLNVADGAPIGLYTITVEMLDGFDTALSADVTEVEIAPAAVHGGGDGGGDDDGTLAPVATITDGPSFVTNETSAIFAFEANVVDAEFSCTLDGSAAAACSSPVTYDGLADGQHTFGVEATAVGKAGAAATWTWTVDTVDPSISILTAPDSETRSTDATFTFDAVGAATVLCSMDGAPLDRCTSPQAYTGLTPGLHAFTAAAVDSAGNYATAIHQWTIVSDDLIVTVGPERLADTRTGTVTPDGMFTGSGPITGGTSVEVQIAGRADVPLDATAVVVNVAIVGAQADGHATVYDCGTFPPTSSVNFQAGETTSNEVIVELSPTGTLCVFTVATADNIVDVAGHL